MSKYEQRKTGEIQTSIIAVVCYTLEFFPIFARGKTYMKTWNAVINLGKHQCTGIYLKNKKTCWCNCNLESFHFVKHWADHNNDKFWTSKSIFCIIARNANWEPQSPIIALSFFRCRVVWQIMFVPMFPKFLHLRHRHMYFVRVLVFLSVVSDFWLCSSYIYIYLSNKTFSNVTNYIYIFLKIYKTKRKDINIFAKSRIHVANSRVHVAKALVVAGSFSFSS